jgi:hypothetical protein
MHCIDWINSELTMLVGSANVVCLLWVVVHLQHSIFGDTPYLLLCIQCVCVGKDSYELSVHLGILARHRASVPPSLVLATRLLAFLLGGMNLRIASIKDKTPPGDPSPLGISYMIVDNCPWRGLCSEGDDEGRVSSIICGNGCLA